MSRHLTFIINIEVRPHLYIEFHVIIEPLVVSDFFFFTFLCSAVWGAMTSLAARGQQPLACFSVLALLWKLGEKWCQTSVNWERCVCVCVCFWGRRGGRERVTRTRGIYRYRCYICCGDKLWCFTLWKAKGGGVSVCLAGKWGGD